MSDRLNDNLKITVYIFKFQINKKSASILNPVTLMGGIDYESARVILTGIQSGKANSISQNQLNWFWKIMKKIFLNVNALCKSFYIAHRQIYYTMRQSSFKDLEKLNLVKFALCGKVLGPNRFSLLPKLHL